MEINQNCKKSAQVDLSEEIKKIQIERMETRSRKSNSINRTKSPAKQEKLLERRGNYDESIETQSIRRTVCSPAPAKLLETSCEENYLDLSTNTAFPHITVQKCEEHLPDINMGKKLSPPGYIPVTRSGSSSSLEIPSPVLEKRSHGGKEISVLFPGNLDSSLSRSEGCLYTELAAANAEKNKSDILMSFQSSSGNRTQRKSTRPVLQTVNSGRKVTRSVSPRVAKRLPCTDITFTPTPTKISDK